MKREIVNQYMPSAINYENTLTLEMIAQYNVDEKIDQDFATFLYWLSVMASENPEDVFIVDWEEAEVTKVIKKLSRKNKGFIKTFLGGCKALKRQYSKEFDLISQGYMNGCFDQAKLSVAMKSRLENLRIIALNPIVRPLP